MTTAEAIRQMITEAHRDGELSIGDMSMLRDSITDCVREARRQEGCAIAAKLTAGSLVRISATATLRPRYILGTEATVIKINQTTASITLGEVRGGSGRFFTGQEIRCPLDTLELVEGL